MAEISNPLYEYYSEKRSLIERSIDTIITPKCTVESMNHLVGQVDLRWDFNTLQKYFFNPVYEYMNKRAEHIIGLSTCLFLEAAGSEPENFIPILALPVFFQTSNDIFTDITDWTDMNKVKHVGRSALEISITGNVSIALLTLPVQNLIFHRLDLETEKSLKVYESFTTNIFNSLFGNGIKLFWEQSKKIPADFNEYYEAASLLNRGFLKFGGDLWLIFQEKNHDEIIIAALNKFIGKMSLAIQLERDILSFERIKMDLLNYKTDHSNLLSNFLLIHAAKKLNNTTTLNHNLSDEYLIELIDRTKSVIYTQRLIEELKRISDKALAILPIEEKYKELLKYYCDYLVYR
jgi:geranylgeranyl pyrophosphate synthase